MLNITEPQKGIYHIAIIQPRLQQDEVEFLTFLREVIKKDSFGLILQVEGDKAFSPCAKKDLGLWFKSNKAKLSVSCTGFARINTDSTKLDTLKSRAMRLAMPCPYIILNNIDSALKWFR